MINMCFNPINGSGSADLSELLHVYTGTRARARVCVCVCVCGGGGVCVCVFP